MLLRVEFGVLFLAAVLAAVLLRPAHVKRPEPVVLRFEPCVPWTPPRTIPARLEMMPWPDEEIPMLTAELIGLRAPRERRERAPLPFPARHFSDPDVRRTELHASDPVPRTEAVTRAVRWLVRHQEPDGRWSSSDRKRDCVFPPCLGDGEEGNDLVVTSLAISGLVAAGVTPRSREEWFDPERKRVYRAGRALGNGTRWLLRQIDDRAFIGNDRFPEVVATTALCDVVRVSPGDQLRRAAVRAVRRLEEWTFDDRTPYDLSAGWQIRAFVAAERAGVPLSRTILTEAVRCLELLTDPDSDISAQFRSSGLFEANAWATYARSWIGNSLNTDLLKNGLTVVLTDNPTREQDMSDRYVGSLAVRACIPDSTWLRFLLTKVQDAQVHPDEGCAGGSWDTPLPGLGRVGSTALALLILCPDK